MSDGMMIINLVGVVLTSDLVCTWMNYSGRLTSVYGEVVGLVSTAIPQRAIRRATEKRIIRIKWNE